jgi:hypothetical protein
MALLRLSNSPKIKYVTLPRLLPKWTLIPKKFSHDLYIAFNWSFLLYYPQ